MLRRVFNLALMSGLLGRAWRAAAEEPPPAELPNLVEQTGGGKQLWRDELFFHRWHIQRNVLTDHCRLLDKDQRRHAWGTFEQCRAKLDSIRQEQKLPPMQGTGVVLLHGLMRHSGTMTKLGDYLRRRGRFSVFNVAYPTTRGNVGEHAAGLAKIVDSLEGIERIHFVGHSLGNLVVRHYLADMAAPGAKPDPRVGRIVMLGPPNHGARLAEVFGRNDLFELVVGAAGGQIARDWQQLEAKLATPQGEFGIIAGGRGDERGYNPLLGEDNDLVVTVRSAKLVGATDFAVLPVLHTVMMDDARVQERTLTFLQHGYFTSADKRAPIAAEEK